MLYKFSYTYSKSDTSYKCFLNNNKNIQNTLNDIKITT